MVNGHRWEHIDAELEEKVEQVCERGSIEVFTYSEAEKLVDYALFMYHYRFGIDQGPTGFRVYKK